MPVLVDVEIGMGRTGIQPGDAAGELYALIEQLPNLVPDGLHAYDGHIHDTDLAQRRHAAQSGLKSTLALRDRLLKRGLARASTGGRWYTNHADTCQARSGWRRMFARYNGVLGQQLPDAISRPTVHPGGLAPDTGDQSPEPRSDLHRPGLQGRRLRPVWCPRIVFSHSTMPESSFTAKSTWFLRQLRQKRTRIGTPLLAIPTHVCPSVALHRRAYVIEDGQVVGQWEVTARDRVLGV